MTEQILGLLEIKYHRGICGVKATEAWIMEALEVLLRAELKRQEREKYERSE